MTRPGSRRPETRRDRASGRKHRGDGPAPASAPRRKHTESGVALLVALFSMTLLTVLILGFTFTSQVQHRRATHWLQRQQAALLAEAGVTLAAEALIADTMIDSLAAGGRSDSWHDLWAGRRIVLAREGGQIAVQIEDLNGRFPLNAKIAVRSAFQQQAANRQNQRETARALGDSRANFERILASAGLDPALFGPLRDWLDHDDQTTASPEGAEQSYYSELQPPYRPRNGRLRSFAELGLIRGFTPEVLLRLRPLVRVAGSPDDPKVNINTAPPQVLRGILPNSVHDLDIDRILAARRIAPLKSADDIPELMSGRALPESKIRFDSDTFRVRSTGTVDDVSESVEAVIRRAGANTGIQYWLARRGPNIAEITEDQAAAASETGQALTLSDLAGASGQTP